MEDGCMSARCPKVSFALLSVSRERGFPRFPWLNHNVISTKQNFRLIYTTDKIKL